LGDVRSERESYDWREIFVALVPFFVAPFLCTFAGSLANFTYHVWNQNIEIFCGLEALALVWIAYARLKAGRDAAGVVVRFGAFMVFLLFISETRTPAWDYQRYLEAARSLCRGENPYADNPYYLYTPFLAQLFCYGSSLLKKLGASDFAAWHSMTYLYRASQFYLAVYIYHELVRLLGLWERGRLKSELVIAALFVLSVPFFRTIVMMQTNLIILALALLAIRFIDLRRDALCGLALALGTLLKLYPLILVIPFLMLKRYRVIIWWAVFGAVLGGVLFAVAPFAWWGYLKNPVPASELFSLFRNNAIAASIATHIKAFGAQPNYRLLSVVALILKVLLAVPVFVGLARVNFAKADFKAIWGLYAVTLAVGIVLSPIIWEHHFILAFPLAVWVIGELGMSARTLLPLALIFPIPAFDLAFLSLHRLIGLIWLIVLAYKRLRARVI